MGEVTGFMKYARQEFEKLPVVERIKHWNEFIQILENKEMSKQGARCMDCGVPFCQSGCPIGNIIPDWNDLIFHNRWKEAIALLHKTNNFPEFTGRICPAPCENACVLGITNDPVSIKNIEVAIIEQAYKEGWIRTQSPKKRINKKIAIIGSGPSGLACADQLNKKGYHVTVFEKNEVLGGLLTLGIPNFKLEKSVVARRLKLMEEEGVKFKTKINVGVDLSAADLKSKYDAIVLCGGAEQPRDLPVPGRELKGIYFAMEFLTQQTRRILNQKISADKRIDAKDKNVIVLGGGDTGSDCVGTANRQGARSIKQFELLPRPPKEREKDNPWPNWALIERTSTSHEEGVERDYGIMTKSFSGENGVLKKIHAVRLEFGEKDPLTGRRDMKEIYGSEFELDVDLVFLAMGFLGPVKSKLIKDLDLELDGRGNVKADKNKMTNVSGVFTAGDMTRGQSLVVWAIHEGRTAAEGVDRYLKELKDKK